jgi:DNA-binding FadR family transcriptional regulator
MLSLLQPIKNEGLKELCVSRLEALVLSGKIQVGHKLPPERELARQLGVSRPVIHEALVDLAGKGLVTLVPRVGAVINDFRKQGSVALLTSLLKYHKGDLAPQLLESLLAMRVLFEIETARLAAIHRSDGHNQELREVIAAEERTEPTDIERLTALDFDFHHLVAMASGNQSYPLLINSFKPVYTNISGQFFKDPAVVPTVIGFHRDLADAIKKQNAELAVAVMRCLLAHGEEHLRGENAG